MDEQKRKLFNVKLNDIGNLENDVRISDSKGPGTQFQGLADRPTKLLDSVPLTAQ
jgi:hypothetical protein